MIDEAINALRLAVDGLLALDLCGESSPSITTALAEVETQRRRLAAVDVGLLTQVRDRGLAAEHCRTSVADLLVELLRVAPGEARARLAMAEDLGPRWTLSGEVVEPALPQVAQALAEGAVSPAHVAVIGHTLERLPDTLTPDVFPIAERFLLDAARDEHPRALERTARLLLARLDPDGTEPRDEREDRREFTLTPHASGWSTVRGRLDAATTAALHAVLDPLAAPAQAADGTLDPRTAGQRRHDAMYEMARRLLRAGDLPPSGGLPATVILRTDRLDPTALATGVRGAITPLRDLLPCADAGCGAEIVRVGATPAGAPLRLERTRRLASPAQRLALIARDGGCSFPGCDRPPAWTEAHHILAWQDGGATNLDNLCLLCAWHHREFARRNWQVHIAADGLPEWLPPKWLAPDQIPRRNIAHQLRELTRPAPDPP